MAQLYPCDGFGKRKYD